MNLLKFFAWGLLTLSLMSVAYADPVKQTATVTIINGFSDIPYNVFDYVTSGDAVFANKPDQIPALGSVAIDISLDPGSSAGFKFKALNNPECIIDPSKNLGHCFELKLTNISNIGPSTPCPAAHVLDNLKEMSNVTYSCTVESNHLDLIVRTDV